MKFVPDFKRIIAEALADTTADHPKALSELVEYVDARQKLVINYDELYKSLKALVESGRMQQIGERYCAASFAHGKPSTFTGLSEEAYQQAEKEYRQRLWREYKELRKREP